MAILIEAEKKFYKIQHSSMMKGPKPPRIKYLSIIKATFGKTIANNILNEERLKSISTRIVSKKRVSTFSILIQ